MKVNRKFWLVLMFLSVLLFLLVIWNGLNQRVALHWDSNGEVNGYGDKTTLLWMVLGMNLLGWFGYWVMEKMVFGKFTKKAMSSAADLILGLIAFLNVVLLLVMVTNLGLLPNLNFGMVGAMVILNLVLAVTLPGVQQNWWIGIRTKWTLENKKIWVKTHKMAGVVYVVSALSALLGLVMSRYALWFAITPLLLGSIYLVWYSWWCSRKKYEE